MTVTATEIAVVVCTLSALAVWVIAHNAPRGWEGRDGFHLGERSEHSDFDGDA